MKKTILLLVAGLISSINFAFAQKTAKDKHGNSYTTYADDPTGSRWYTLENGLTVILAVNEEKPRVQTLIATKAGSSSDPADNTGLAHYLEHMLFKGTDKYGSLDYSKEKVYLKQIDELYEKYNQTTDEAKRKQIYREIDSVSGIAAKYAIANEYDKMMQTIGAQGTNAFTSFEQTVYVNNIPANQISTWLDIESERFRNPVLRLFHTELEAVYEEKNRSLDNDRSKVFEAMMAASFPNHNYGRQTTIGTIEDLKNPSLIKIREYFNTYYVPNNMAIIMAGDLDPADVYLKIKANFSFMKPGTIPKMKFKDEDPLAVPKTIEITGPDAASLQIAYRIPDALDKDAGLAKLVDLILNNSSAGLIDLNLVKAQKCLRAGCYPMQLKERGLHVFYGSPLEGQSLQELEQLIYGELDKLKNGDFDMDLIHSIVLNEKVSRIRNYESADGIAYDLLESFILGSSWSAHLAELDEMLKYSKKDIVAYAKKYYGEGRVVIYKKEGETTDKIQIEKPHITKVEVNRDETSGFVSEINNREVKPIAPQILNYDEEIIFDQFREGIPIWKVKHGDDELFSLYYVLDLGRDHDRKLALAVQYLQYLGTEDLSSEDISKEFYKLACDFGVSAGDDQSYVYLSGLSSNFEPALALFEKLLSEAKADEESWNQLKGRILKSRADAKLRKNTILFSRMIQYALYGETNSTTDILSEEELNEVKASDLTDYIHNLTSYKHKVWYNGPLSVEELKQQLNEYHSVPEAFLPSPELTKYAMLDTDEPKVYFVDYDMVQAEIVWLKKSNQFNKEEVPNAKIFNEYFGGGMSSIVFQEIREAKALAYSTFSSYSVASRPDEYNIVLAYVGTQADKLPEAIKAMNLLLTELPESQTAFLTAKTALRQNLESSRILKMSILFDYDKNQKLGYTEDSRKQLATELSEMTMEDVIEFHNTKLSGNYVICVLGSKDKVDMDVLAEYGEVIILSLEEIFGY
ncbi:insulinase family protein [bacterium]|nr:insulinase family protein [bacterium]